MRSVAVFMTLCAVGDQGISAQSEVVSQHRRSGSQWRIEVVERFGYDYARAAFSLFHVNLLAERVSQYYRSCNAYT
jgi:hypothetical protein